MKKLFYLLLLQCICFGLMAQVVTTEAPFPTPDQEITILFNADEGNKGLENCNCDVYLHTGVITSNSTSGSDWKYVQGVWGEDIPRLKMNRVSANQYSYTLTIRDFYGVPTNEDIQQLAFVFRNVDGTEAGRATDGSDVFLQIFSEDEALVTQLTSPTQSNVFVQPGEAITIEGQTNRAANLRIEENGMVLSSTSSPDNALSFVYTPTNNPGNYQIDFIAGLDSGIEDTTSFQYFILPEVNIADPTAEFNLGLNRNGDGSATFVLNAPDKEYAFLLIDINDFQPSTDYFMNRSEDGQFFWVTIDDLGAPDTWHTYQYLVDGTLQIADPLSELILDPSNDRFIAPDLLPDGLPTYPTNGNGIVSVFKEEGFPYEWQVADFAVPAEEDLVVYELLMRDFLSSHSYADLIDTLDYFERLGINAIELMPINEFEGNDSWGYNPSFHMALDKYYGDPITFKRFIDEAHARGMAVIIDVVYNHAFSQSPLAQLYWDAGNQRPAADNPWLNVMATHPFNVGYDFNHESIATRRFVDQVMAYWLQEYRIDGFRFDLSKGFTQVNSGDDVGRWSNYDASRIAIIEHYYDVVKSVNADAYVILEHFGSNREELELSNYGAMFWNNMNFQYNEATMGYSSDLRGTSYADRGWNAPKLVTYMESHDEERLMYKNLEFGNSSGDYDVTDLPTALQRVAMVSTFFYTIPGPKMLWEFGELGYELSINYCRNGTVNDGCRLDPKPIRWNYINQTDRQRLFEITSGLIHLKKEYPVFRTRDYLLDVARPGKLIQLNHSDFNVNIIGNFDVTPISIDPKFQNTGQWYEYFTGDTLEVTNTNALIDLQPGEYRLYTSVSIGRLITSNDQVLAYINDFKVAPNPVVDVINIQLDLKQQTTTNLALFDLSGKIIADRSLGDLLPGTHQFQLPAPPIAGTYLVLVQIEGGLSVYERVVVLD